MDRRHFGKTSLALSSSLLIPKISSGKTQVCTNGVRTITHITSLYFFRNLLNDPFNLVIRRDTKKALIIEHINIKEINLFFLRNSNLPMQLVLINDIGYVYVPVQPLGNGHIAHLHNVEINLLGTLIIKNIYIPANKIGSLNITTTKSPSWNEK